MRYFRASAAIYEAVRKDLDGLYGHPFRSDAEHPEEVTTESCMVPVAMAPRDVNGLCLVAVSEEDAARPEVAARIEDLKGRGLVEEVGEGDFVPVIE